MKLSILIFLARLREVVGMSEDLITYHTGGVQEVYKRYTRSGIQEVYKK